MSSGIPVQDSQEFVRRQMNYWEQVSESGGFDIEHISAPPMGLLTYDCEDKRNLFPNRLLVNLYARLGIYRYNLSKGTNLKFHHLTKFNMTNNCISSYRITLVAYDPVTTSLVTFLVGISEEEYARLNLMLFIARPQADKPHCQEPVRPIGSTIYPLTPDACDDKGLLPFWPTNFEDTSRFRLMNESELQGNDWIRLYLELALCSNDRNIPESHLSQLQIVRVAVEEAVEHADLIFYITFKGLPVARVGEDGEHVERRVIIRTFEDPSTGYFTLMGGFGFSVGEDTSHRRPMTRPQSIDEICAEQKRLDFTPPPCPPTYMADWWKS
ncbi:UPF0725 protein [Raphanus sativus]|uniref:UPF0725 protein At3g19520-like n=1 Tax=Raphanus sativus TaxID=3726 RepID=A0A9W3CVL8_RAPSA|nr:UPF0725 protein At3g19520-like [Raphanus sativus]KAJ4868555.1 UPF0725 protein [Raphanus sativus]